VRAKMQTRAYGGGEYPHSDSEHAGLVGIDVRIQFANSPSAPIRRAGGAIFIGALALGPQELRRIRRYSPLMGDGEWFQTCGHRPSAIEERLRESRGTGISVATAGAPCSAVRP